MELGGVGLMGDVVEIDGFCIVGVDEKLGLHEASVEEYLGISFCGHRGISFVQLWKYSERWCKP